MVVLSTNSTARDFKVYSPNNVFSGKTGVQASFATRAIAENVTVDGCGTAFFGYACIDSQARRIRATNWTNNGISFDGAGTTNCHIVDCDSDGTLGTGNGNGM